MAGNWRTRAIAPTAALVLAAAVAPAITRPALAAPTSVTVTSTADSGAGSLRQAIIDANSFGNTDAAHPTTITFALPTPATISLESDLPAIAGSAAISGPGATKLTVSGKANARPFTIAAGATVTLNGLTITEGNVAERQDLGGGILNDGTLAVTSAVVTGNSAYIGGGIANRGTLTVTSSTISSNVALFSGGISSGGPLTLVNSTVSSNSAVAVGTLVGVIGGRVGAIGFGAGPNLLLSSTVTDNSGVFPPVGVSVSSGALSVVASTSGPIESKASTVRLAGSALLGPCERADGGSFVDDGFNVASDATCGLTTAGSRPSAILDLGALAANGGTTLTRLPGAASQALGAIPTGTAVTVNAASVTLCPRRDQRGFTSPSGQACAAGAVNRVSQTITFNQPAVTLANSPLRLAGRASSGLGVSYASTTTGVCTVSGATVALLAPGVCTITADQVGSSRFLPADRVSRSFRVGKVAQAPVVVTTTGGTFGTPLPLAATGGSGTGALNFTAAPGTAAGCRVVGSSPYALVTSSSGTCRVKATRAGDDWFSARSSGVTSVAIAAVAPTPPRSVLGSPLNRAARITWRAPVGSGGAPLTRYVVTASPTQGSGRRTCTAAASRTAPPETACTVTGLVNGVAYRFTVTAANASRTSAPSAASRTVTAGAPSVVRRLRVSFTAARTVRATWNAPASAGSGPVVRFHVRWSADGGRTWSAWRNVGTVRSATRAALDPGVEGQVQVRARNGSGYGPIATRPFIQG